MAVKLVEIPAIGAVKLYKRKGVRSIRLSVNAAGEVRVSLPYWLPYEAGAKFAHAKADWIQAQLQDRTQELLVNGQAIGKSHHLYIVRDFSASRVSSRVSGSIIRITFPANKSSDSPEVQRAAQTAAVKALRSQAERLLPQRLRTLASIHGFAFKSVSVKRLKGRWGSCDAQKNIVLNLYLMQLPWQLIDYVLLHELTHTQALNHGPDFWEIFQRCLPTAKDLRREIRRHRPAIG
jgi:predicted metal-dependent hydrolase